MAGDAQGFGGLDMDRFTDGIARIINREVEAATAPLTARLDQIARLSDGEQEAASKAFLAKHGDKPVTHGYLHQLNKEMAEVVAAALKEKLDPMRRQIDALEAEVRSGHARLKALEAGHRVQEGEADDV